MYREEPVETMRWMYEKNPRPYTAAQIAKRITGGQIAAIEKIIEDSGEAVKCEVRIGSRVVSFGWVPKERIEEVADNVRFERQDSGRSYEPRICGNMVL